MLEMSLSLLTPTLATSSRKSRARLGDSTPRNDRSDTSVIPYRGFVGLVTPPTTYAGSAALKTSYGVEAGPYLIHTPSSGLVLGPYTSALEGIVDDEEVYGIEDDSEVLPRMREWIANYCKDKFDGWGTEVVGEPGEGLARVWSGESGPYSSDAGILAWSIDRVPLVGPVPDHPGLWVSMAYNGEWQSRQVSR